MNRLFQSRLFYLLLLIVEFLLSILVNSLPIIWRDFVYLPNEHYCFFELTNIRITVWLILFDYGFSFLLISLLYLRIILFLRHQRSNLTTIVQQKQQRNLIVLRRILLIIILEISIGLPPIVIIILSWIRGQTVYLAFQFIWSFLVWSFTATGISLILFIPQLKFITKKISRTNQIAQVQ